MADAIVLDEDSSRTYLHPESGQSQASSSAHLGEARVFSDNTSPTATTPMRLFAQETSGADLGLRDVPAFASDEPSWSFFMVAADPYRTWMVVVADQRSGRMAGVPRVRGRG